MPHSHAQLDAEDRCSQAPVPRTIIDRADVVGDSLIAPRTRKFDKWLRRSMAIMVLSATGAAFSWAYYRAVYGELEQEAEFHIPAQSLTAALDDFAFQAKVSTRNPVGLVEGKNSRGVTGTWTKRAALQQLLKGTDLQFTAFFGEITLTGRGEDQSISKLPPPGKPSPPTAKR